MYFLSKVIVVVVFAQVTLILASNNFADFEANDIYTTYDLSDCVFPFQYNGVTYKNCTTDGTNGDRPWCSLNADYIGLFKYCYDFWASKLQCTFPFTINGKSFTSCGILNPTVPYRQCKSNNNKYRYRICIEDHISRPTPPLLHPNQCDPAYLALSPNHTICAGPSSYAIAKPISDADKADLVATHNQYRAAVDATNMMALYWDDELAKLAQARSSLCGFDHDLAINRLSPKYGWRNGQNMVMSTDMNRPLSGLLRLMFDSEQPRFIYGTGCSSPGTCTHYTQLMISTLTRVGCAEAHCLFPDRIERYFTCNYIDSQYSNNYMIPYKQGASGADCPAKKNSAGLCDCGNAICNTTNGEVINPNTCSCIQSSKRSLEQEDLMERNANDDDADTESFKKIISAVSSGNSPGVMGDHKRSHHGIPAWNPSQKRNELEDTQPVSAVVQGEMESETAKRNFKTMSADRQHRLRNLAPGWDAQIEHKVRDADAMVGALEANMEEKK